MTEEEKQQNLKSIFKPDNYESHDSIQHILDTPAPEPVSAGKEIVDAAKQKLDDSTKWLRAGVLSVGKGLTKSPEVGLLLRGGAKLFNVMDQFDDQFLNDKFIENPTATKEELEASGLNLPEGTSKLELTLMKQYKHNIQELHRRRADVLNMPEDEFPGFINKMIEEVASYPASILIPLRLFKGARKGTKAFYGLLTAESGAASAENLASQYNERVLNLRPDKIDLKEAAFFGGFTFAGGTLLRFLGAAWRKLRNNNTPDWRDFKHDGGVAYKEGAVETVSSKEILTPEEQTAQIKEIRSDFKAKKKGEEYAKSFDYIDVEGKQVKVPKKDKILEQGDGQELKDLNNHSDFVEDAPKKTTQEPDQTIKKEGEKGYTLTIHEGNASVNKAKVWIQGVKNKVSEAINGKKVDPSKKEAVQTLEQKYKNLSQIEQKLDETTNPEEIKKLINEAQEQTKDAPSGKTYKSLSYEEFAKYTDQKNTMDKMKFQEAGKKIFNNTAKENVSTLQNLNNEVKARFVNSGFLNTMHQFMKQDPKLQKAFLEDLEGNMRRFFELEDLPTKDLDAIDSKTLYAEFINPVVKKLYKSDSTAPEFWRDSFRQMWQAHKSGHKKVNTVKNINNNINKTHHYRKQNPKEPVSKQINQEQYEINNPIMSKAQKAKELDDISKAEWKYYKEKGWTWDEYKARKAEDARIEREQIETEKILERELEAYAKQGVDKIDASRQIDADRDIARTFGDGGGLKRPVREKLTPKERAELDARIKEDSFKRLGEKKPQNKNISEDLSKPESRAAIARRIALDSGGQINDPYVAKNFPILSRVSKVLGELKPLAERIENIGFTEKFKPVITEAEKIKYQGKLRRISDAETLFREFEKGTKFLEEIIEIAGDKINTQQMKSTVIKIKKALASKDLKKIEKTFKELKRSIKSVEKLREKILPKAAADDFLTAEELKFAGEQIENQTELQVKRVDELWPINLGDRPKTLDMFIEDFPEFDDYYKHIRNGLRDGKLSKTNYNKDEFLQYAFTGQAKRIKKVDKQFEEGGKRLWAVSQQEKIDKKKGELINLIKEGRQTQQAKKAANEKLKEIHEIKKQVDVDFSKLKASEQREIIDAFHDGRLKEHVENMNKIKAKAKKLKNNKGSADLAFLPAFMFVLNEVRKIVKDIDTADPIASKVIDMYNSEIEDMFGKEAFEQVNEQHARDEFYDRVSPAS